MINSQLDRQTVSFFLPLFLGGLGSMMGITPSLHSLSISWWHDIQKFTIIRIEPVPENSRYIYLQDEYILVLSTLLVGLRYHSAQISQCSDITALRYHSAQISQCSDIKVLRYHSAQISQCSDITVLRYHSAQITNKGLSVKSSSNIKQIFSQPSLVLRPGL